MNIQRTTSISLLLMTLSCASLTWAGQRDSTPLPANVGQVDFDGNWYCPSANTFPTFVDVPVSLSLTTTGGPVLVSFTLNMDALGQYTMLMLSPVADEQSINADVAVYIYTRGLVTLTRVVILPAGVHSFGVKMACEYSAAVASAWLTAYELPSIPR